MKHPSRKEIEAELEKLRELRPRVRHHTFFGDDNRAAIEAQIRVLDEAMDEDEIYEQGWPEHTQSAAIDVLNWREGESETVQSEEWSALAK